MAGRRLRRAWRTHPFAVLGLAAGLSATALLLRHGGAAVCLALDLFAGTAPGWGKARHFFRCDSQCCPVKQTDMKDSPLIFIGIKGSVVALNRATGQQVWATHLKGSDFVNVVLLDGAVLASDRKSTRLNSSHL